MKRLLRILGLLLFTVTGSVLGFRSFGADELPQSLISGDESWAGKSEMNGHALKEYGEFYSKWKLVTVRYRKDTGEQRFVYANPKAWKALLAGRTEAPEFPDGSVFAKIAYQVQEDPAFPSSVMPARSRRYQLMVRDRKRYASTDGWGYALFDSGGKTVAGNPEVLSKACLACHRIVLARGQIFSQPIDLEPLVSAVGFRKPEEKETARLVYSTIAAETLPPSLLSRLPKGTKKVRSLEGELTKTVFFGTLDEIGPALGTETMKSGLPAVLLSADKAMYSASFVDPASGTCKKDGTDGTSISFIFAWKTGLNPKLSATAEGFGPQGEGHRVSCYPGKPRDP